jgi:hypothetical protein
VAPPSDVRWCLLGDPPINLVAASRKSRINCSSRAAPFRSRCRQPCRALPIGARADGITLGIGRATSSFEGGELLHQLRALLVEPFGKCDRDLVWVLVLEGEARRRRRGTAAYRTRSARACRSPSIPPLSFSSTARPARLCTLRRKESSVDWNWQS